MKIARPGCSARVALLALSSVFALAGVASGRVVPGGVQHQGLATDADGVPLDGLADLTRASATRSSPRAIFRVIGS